MQLIDFRAQASIFKGNIDDNFTQSGRIFWQAVGVDLHDANIEKTGIATSAVSSKSEPLNQLWKTDPNKPPGAALGFVSGFSFIAHP